MSMMATGARPLQSVQQRFEHPARALRVDVADERHQHHARVERDERRRELREQLVLHADDLFAQARVLGLGALPLDDLADLAAGVRHHREQRLVGRAQLAAEEFEDGDGLAAH
jgi:hypothetical protein